MFLMTEGWKSTYPGACAGFLAMEGVANPARHAGLDRLKGELEADLRERFTGAGREALRALPEIRAYEAYYRPFKKTYHVLLQLESVALKGKALPNVAALVEAMFMAELKDRLLTAGHDLDSVQGPVKVDAAAGGEGYTLLNGQEAELKTGDMFMADDLGVISSVLYGPDARTRLTPDTRRALFAVYAPAGIGAQAVQRHLEELRDYVWVVAPGAAVEMMEVLR